MAYLRLAVLAVVVACAEAQTRRTCQNVKVTPTEGSCGGQRINTRVCARTEAERQTLETSLSSYWSRFDAYSSCQARLTGLCSLAGPLATQRDLENAEVMYPFCTNLITCNPLNTGTVFAAASGQPGLAGVSNVYCERDEDCEDASGTRLMTCCNSLRSWVDSSCSGIDRSFLDGRLTDATVCKQNNENCVSFGAASSLSAATLFTALLAVATSLLVSW